MNITEDKLKAAIQIALGGNGIYTHELESELVHHIKALSIDGVSKSFYCENEDLLKCQKCEEQCYDCGEFEIERKQ